MTVETTLTTKNLQLPSSVSSMILGDFLSFRRGFGGVEYSGVRLYEPGDPPKDFNRVVSEKHGELFVNARYPDRELEVLLIPDLTASMQFGSVYITKNEALFASILQIIELLGEDRIVWSIALPEAGQWTFSLLGKNANEVRRNLEQIWDQISARNPKVFDFGDALDEARRQLGKNSLFAVVLSDFIDVPECTIPLRAFVGEGNRVVGVAILDTMEIAPPTVRWGAIAVRDLETGEDGLIQDTCAEHVDRHQEIFKARSCNLVRIIIEKEA